MAPKEASSGLPSAAGATPPPSKGKATTSPPVSPALTPYAEKLPKYPKQADWFADEEASTDHKGLQKIISACQRDRRLVRILVGKLDDAEQNLVTSRDVAREEMMNPKPANVERVPDHVLASWIQKHSTFSSADLISVKSKDSHGLVRLFTLATQMSPTLRLKDEMWIASVFGRVATDQSTKFGDRLKDVGSECMVDGRVNYDLIGCYSRTWNADGVLVALTHRQTTDQVNIDTDEVRITKKWKFLDNNLDHGAAFQQSDSSPPWKADSFFSKLARNGPWNLDVIETTSNNKFKEYLETIMQSWETDRAKVVGSPTRSLQTELAAAATENKRKGMADKQKTALETRLRNAKRARESCPEVAASPSKAAKKPA